MAVLVFADAHAGWWSHAPVDFEECAAGAEKNATSPEDKNARLTACEARFAGRRKPGGGYTYFDFMQNRHFDIAGPNPTAAEQKYIDEQYAAFLKDQRRSIIAAAFFRERQQVGQARTTIKTTIKADDVAGSGNINVRPTTTPKTVKRATLLPRPRPKMIPHCEEQLFSTCNWSRISNGMRNLKKALFGAFLKDERGS
ncbi:MAG: hypothetical protein NTAFB05_30620 [Nitrobacter sp.]